MFSLPSSIKFGNWAFYQKVTAVLFYLNWYLIKWKAALPFKTFFFSFPWDKIPEYNYRYTKNINVQEMCLYLIFISGPSAVDSLIGCNLQYQIFLITWRIQVSVIIYSNYFGYLGSYLTDFLRGSFFHILVQKWVLIEFLWALKFFSTT